MNERQDPTSFPHGAGPASPASFHPTSLPCCTSVTSDFAVISSNNNYGKNRTGRGLSPALGEEQSADWFLEHRKLSHAPFLRQGCPHPARPALSRLSHLSSALTSSQKLSQSAPGEQMQCPEPPPSINTSAWGGILAVPLTVSSGRRDQVYPNCPDLDPTLEPAPLPPALLTIGGSSICPLESELTGAQPHLLLHASPVPGNTASHSAPQPPAARDAHLTVSI